MTFTSLSKVTTSKVLNCRKSSSFVKSCIQSSSDRVLKVSQAYRWKICRRKLRSTLPSTSKLTGCFATMTSWKVEELLSLSTWSRTGRRKMLVIWTFFLLTRMGSLTRSPRASCQHGTPSTSLRFQSSRTIRFGRCSAKTSSGFQSLAGSTESPSPDLQSTKKMFQKEFLS